MTMRWTRPAACLVTLLLVSLPLTTAAFPHNLPPGCEEAIRSAHERIASEKNTISLADAVTLVQASGSICGFDLTGAQPTTTDAFALWALLDSLNGGYQDGAIPSPNLPHAGGMGRLPGGLGVPSLESAETTPCGLPGSGPGTLDAKVLGIDLGSQGAAGTWKTTTDKTKEVSGSGGDFSGVEADGTGTATLAIVPLPTTGNTNIWCTNVTVTETVGEKCRFVFNPVPPDFSMGEECDVITRTDAHLEPLGADAHQESILKLVTLDHEYTYQAPPSSVNDA